jgi:hypothetical protein
MRLNEWFVPRFGSPRFRAAVGLLFLPYTGMVLAFTLMGAMIVEVVHWDRVAAILAIYFLALGIAAHALDALGSRETKPWGDMFSKRQLRLLAFVSVAAAYAIGLPYMLGPAPLLWFIAILEGFFLLAYNLEWFEGRFHTDGWFALSWGALPVLAGHVLQTNSISLAAVLVACAAVALSLVEITASRPYKRLRRSAGSGPAAGAEQAHMRALQAILQCVSLGVILMGLGLVAWRWTG